MSENPSRRDSTLEEEKQEIKPLQEPISKIEAMKIRGFSKGEIRREKIYQFICKLLRTDHLEWGIIKCGVFIFSQVVFFMIAILIGAGINSYFFNYPKCHFWQAVLIIMIIDLTTLVLWKFFYCKDKY